MKFSLSIHTVVGITPREHFRYQKTGGTIIFDIATIQAFAVGGTEETEHGWG